MKWTHLGRAACFVTLASLGVSALAFAAEVTVTKRVSPEEQNAASAYWTRERLANTPAIPMPVDDGSSALSPENSATEAVLGPAGAVAPSGPAWNADSVAQTAYPRDWLAEDEGLDGEGSKAVAGTAGVYTYYDVNNQSALWTIFPHRWSGRLTYNTAAGPFYCSATVISGNNIVTAAHCVYDTTNNVWYSNWVFTPAYRNGSTPYGTFATSACTVMNSWVGLSGSYSISTWARHDVAVCSLRPNSAGQTINSAVVWAGRTWNTGNNQLIFNSGYPSRSYTDATITGASQYLRSCTAESFLYTTETLGSGCYWGRGSSGGSWLINYKPFLVSGWVNSVNSGLFIGQQNSYGARFNSNNIVPLCTTRGC